MKKFEAIIGYETEKEELMRLCDVMRNKEKYSALGVEMPKAILLHGEPGLGKTLMAKTLIEESGRKCFSCKKDRADGAFVDKIRETFESAISVPMIPILSPTVSVRYIITKEVKS